MDPFRKETIIEGLAEMTEAEFLDVVGKARHGGRHNPQTKKEEAAAAMRQFVSAPRNED